MPGHDVAKAEKELKVFKLFAQLTRLPVKAGSVVQQADGPDISCELENGETVTYELVTLDSNRSSQTWGDFHSMGGAWNGVIKSMSEQSRQSFFDRYRHASITPEYGTRPDRHYRRERITQMIDRLLEQPAGFLGVLDCGQDKIRVEAKPGRAENHSAGPTMLDGMSPTVQAVAWGRIREKIERRYKIAGRFELIAYSYRDTLFHQAPEDAEPPTADILRWLRGSGFSHVWIVEWHFKRIYRRFERPN
jgi:hypothetical protein